MPAHTKGLVVAHPHTTHVGLSLWSFKPQDTPSRRAKQERPGLRRQPPRHPRRILVIEDDTEIADMYAIRLRQDGWQVDIAPSGEDGVVRALAEPPDLVVLDMMLPGIDGVEVLTKLRSDARTKGVPVLVLSNSAGLSDRIERARRLGVLGWRVKSSTTPSQLSAEVRSFLNRS
jgi:DNA-binding response OmpR family regulator